VREALLALNATLPDLRKAFGARSEVDPVRHLIGAASAWGGNPDKDAIYLTVTPSRNDGAAIYKLNVKEVPVDAFWSVIVYTADGHLQKNQYDAYSLNSITAKKSDDGSVAIHPVRRLRRQDRQLPADHVGLELHGASLSPSCGDLEWQLAIP